jgi:hypothetical protein
MNIVDVLISKVKAKFDKNLFDINSILADPTMEDALERLEECIRRYNANSNILQDAERLKKQMETSVNENQDNANNP